MNHKILIILFTLLNTSIFAQELKISDDKRHIVYKDGKPFFWLGDTAWELFHRTNKEEADLYLQNRADKGFTVIQAVVLAELEGLNVASSNQEKPLIDNDPSKPNEAYFKHVDYIVNKAGELGMFIGMLPTWGDKFNLKWGVGPEVFTPENALVYGKFLGNRYKGKNIIWILGGDRNPENEEDLAIIREMGKGIRSEVGNAQLITMHPQGGSNSAMWFHEDDWLDLNMYQSGHGDIHKNYLVTEKLYKLEPVKPVLDGEPCYEDHPINWKASNGWFDEFDSRRAGYWSMLGGACGHTYGNHNIWQMWLPGRDPISVARTPWTQALNYPGAFQAGYMRKFFESLEWQKLEPASDLITDGPNNLGKEIRCAIATDDSFLLAYSPYGSNFSLDLSKLKTEKLNMTWFNPGIGESISIGEVSKNNTMNFDPPSDEKRGNDWVLVLEVR
ncbi:glycoside hydrolase family 140 protein [Flexithrix dorotheae]|uniref:glycoside hydrolase family 140 protein n=1 Tax=Flexithrix dorotheae TaxID=70993 RepID=UPI00035FD009|nr:glycoside hydrolase family 140 protein [Flexithrix dorotheae]